MSPLCKSRYAISRDAIVITNRVRVQQESNAIRNFVIQVYKLMS